MRHDHLVDSLSRSQHNELLSVFAQGLDAELFETRIFAQRVPERIDLKIAAGFAIGHFEQVRQSGDRRIDIASLRLDDRQRRFLRKV